MRGMGETFAAYTGAAVEEMELDHMQEFNDCAWCNLTPYDRCGDRSWGGSRPAQDHLAVIEVKPWMCTRDEHHEGEHVACADGHHKQWTWTEGSLPQATCKIFTVKKLMEAATLKVPGKFVRRPPLQDLVENSGPTETHPVDVEEPRVEGGVTLYITNDVTKSIVGIDVTDEFAAKLPVVHITEADLHTPESRVSGRKFLRQVDAIHWTNEIYTVITHMMLLLQGTQPTEGSFTHEVFTHLMEKMTEYEKQHFMAS